MLALVSPASVCSLSPLLRVPRDAMHRLDVTRVVVCLSHVMYACTGLIRCAWHMTIRRVSIVSLILTPIMASLNSEPHVGPILASYLTLASYRHTVPTVQACLLGLPRTCSALAGCPLRPPLCGHEEQRSNGPRGRCGRKSTSRHVSLLRAYLPPRVTT